jgi:Family of unknown function (DUF5759)
MSQSLMPPSVPPSSLYTEEARRDATRIRIYNQVLQQIYTKIKAIARIPGNQKSLWYVVPEFIPGTPRFDIGDAILYIVWNLRNTGYTVAYTHPNLLAISWSSHDEVYRTSTSPWSVVLNSAREQAMIERPLIPHIPKPVLPAMPSFKMVEDMRSDIIKRKTPIKKTVEFRPEAVPVAKSGVALPGQLGSRHVSFV